MPRQPRVAAPDRLHHDIARFLNHEFLMIGAQERAEYLRRVPAALARTDARPLAYALMSNHIHWALRAGAAPLSRFFQSLHGGFATWLNRASQRLGPVFAGRFTDVVCPEERTAIVIAYQHNNPVRAGVAADPNECDWTSHRAYVGDVKPPPWLDVELGLTASGFDASPGGRAHFNDFVLARATLRRDPMLSGDGDEETRARARALSGCDCAVSDAAVRSDLAGTQRDIVAVPGAVVRPRWPGSALEVLDAVVRRCGASLEEVQSYSRRRELADVRRVALWLWRFWLGRAQSEMSGVVGISEPSASQLVTKRPRLDYGVIEALADELWAPYRRET